MEDFGTIPHCLEDKIQGLQRRIDCLQAIASSIQKNRPPTPRPFGVRARLRGAPPRHVRVTQCCGGAFWPFLVPKKYGPIASATPPLRVVCPRRVAVYPIEDRGAITPEVGGHTHFQRPFRPSLTLGINHAQNLRAPPPSIHHSAPLWLCRQYLPTRCHLLLHICLRKPHPKPLETKRYLQKRAQTPTNHSPHYQLPALERTPHRPCRAGNRQAPHILPGPRLLRHAALQRG